MKRFSDWQLFAVCVLVWGTTWYAITHQIDSVSPEFGVALRFALASAVVLGTCALRGQGLRLHGRDHLLLAAQGILMYSLAYICVYHAERHVASGLVAVGYAASPLVNGVGARLAFGSPLGGRFVLGGALGLAGVALIFLPEFRRTAASDAVTLGAMFTALAVLMSSFGSLIATRNRERRLAFWPALGYGMGYGALLSMLLVLHSDSSLVLPTAVAWWVALFYLALAGSVLTFACYLSLQERLGPGRASAVGVMTPLVALGASAALEGWRPSALALAGIALAIAGNGLMLWRRPTAR